MTVIGFHPSDIGIAQKIVQGIENMFSTQTSEDFVSISDAQNTTSGAVYAFNPITKTLVEINPAQAWFWTDEWLSDELRVEEEIRAGDFEEFDNIDDFIDSI